MKTMEQIASFSVDHLKLLRGLYVSRKDPVGNGWVTTFDIRMKEPNREPVMDIAVLHTIEHLGATWLRNNSTWKDTVVYFGPMGCRTGCYLLLAGDLDSRGVLELVRDMFAFIAGFDGPIPGAADVECGNWLNHDLPMAVWESDKYLNEVLLQAGQANLEYPG